MGYVNCNNKLDEVFTSSVVSDADALIYAPWVSGSLGRDFRLGVLSVVPNNSIGITTKGNRYKFYYSRARTGRWYARVLPTWLSAFYAGLIFSMYRTIKYFDVGFSSVMLVALGLIALVFFLPRLMLGIGIHSQVADVIGKKFYKSSHVIHWIIVAFAVGVIWDGAEGLLGNAVVLTDFEAHFKNVMANKLHTDSYVVVLKGVVNKILPFALFTSVFAFAVWHMGLNRVGASHQYRALDGTSGIDQGKMEVLYSQSFLKHLVERGDGNLMKLVFVISLIGIACIHKFT